MRSISKIYSGTGIYDTPISSLCWGEVLAKTISGLLKTSVVAPRQTGYNESVTTVYFDPIASLAARRYRLHERRPRLLHLRRHLEDPGQSSQLVFLWCRR
jgi:hypothetical protein